MFREKINKYALSLILVVFMTVSAGQLFAESLSVDINTGAYLLDSNSGRARLLLRFDLPPGLADARLVFAELSLPLTASIPDSSALTVYCHPLAMSWNPDEISWEDLGDSLGSDVMSENETMFATNVDGEQRGYFDITDIVKSWQDTTLANNGLVLFYEPFSVPYFTYSNGLGSTIATVRFDYTQ
jgi:hypothetical protein